MNIIITTGYYITLIGVLFCVMQAEINFFHPPCVLHCGQTSVPYVVVHGQFGNCYHNEFCNIDSFPGSSVTEVKTPPFAESITEGDIQWQKGMSLWLFMKL